MLLYPSGTMRRIGTQRLCWRLCMKTSIAWCVRVRVSVCVCVYVSVCVSVCVCVCLSVSVCRCCSSYNQHLVLLLPWCECVFMSVFQCVRMCVSVSVSMCLSRTISTEPSSTKKKGKKKANESNNKQEQERKKRSNSQQDKQCHLNITTSSLLWHLVINFKTVSRTEGNNTALEPHEPQCVLGSVVLKVE